MAKKFTSASLSDEELADLDPWLQDNLGELDEGSFWIIERNEKTGKVEAVMMDENFTSKSRKTIPDEAISTPLSKEEEESFDKEMPAYRRASRPVRQEGETTAQEVDEVEAERRGDKSGRFGRKQKDFSRPSSVEESRAKSRGQTFTPPPVRKPRFAEPKEEGYKPRFADAKEQPQRKSPKMEEPSARTPRFAAPKADAYKPRFADPVEEEPEAELEPIIDPTVKKPRIKKPSRTAPIVEAEAPAVEETPVAEPAKKDRKNIFQRAGSKVAGAAKGVKDLFDGEDEDTAPAWINDPRVGVSPAGLTRGTARTKAGQKAQLKMAEERGKTMAGGNLDASGFAVEEYWTDPKDGTTYARMFDNSKYYLDQGVGYDEDELPAEVDMTGAAKPEQDLGTVLGRSREENFKSMKPKGQKDEDKEGRPWWVASPPKGFKVIEGSSRDMQMAQEKAKLQASDEAPEGFDRSFSAGSSEWHKSFDSYTGMGIVPAHRTSEDGMYKFRMLVPTGVIAEDEEKKSPRLR
jgi:hypothetical protein